MKMLGAIMRGIELGVNYHWLPMWRIAEQVRRERSRSVTSNHETKPEVSYEEHKPK